MASGPITIKQLNNLGERLRKGQPNAQDLQEIDSFRRSFGSAYQEVINTLRTLGYRPSGRGAKTTESIVAKLKREKTRLSKMQDIAGCRIVVDDVAEQDEAINAIAGAFAECEVKDRRNKPSHGYRAVHIISRVQEFDVEIQVRTTLQDTWAQLSEKLSDNDPEIKYGGGSPEIQRGLLSTTRIVEKFERAEKQYYALKAPVLMQSVDGKIIEFKPEMDSVKHELQQMMEEIIIEHKKEAQR